MGQLIGDLAHEVSLPRTAGGPLTLSTGFRSDAPGIVDREWSQNRSFAPLFGAFVTIR
jgi:hypothetical protein